MAEYDWKTHKNVRIALLGAAGAAELESSVDILWELLDPTEDELVAIQVGGAQTALVRRRADGYQLFVAFDGTPWPKNEIKRWDMFFIGYTWPECWRTARKAGLHPWTGETVVWQKLTPEQIAQAESYRPERQGELVMLRVADNPNPHANMHGDGLWRVAELGYNGGMGLSDKTYHKVGSIPTRAIPAKWQATAKTLWLRGDITAYNQLLARCAQLEYHRARKETGAALKVEVEALSKKDIGEYVLIKHPGAGRGKGKAIYSMAIVNSGGSDIPRVDSENCGVEVGKCAISRLRKDPTPGKDFVHEAAADFYSKHKGRPMTRFFIQADINKRVRRAKLQHQTALQAAHNSKVYG